MAVNCNLTSLISASSTYNDLSLSAKEKLAIEVFLAAKGLAAAGGTNYTANLLALQQAAEAWYPLNQSTRDAIALYLAVQNAVSEGASITQTVKALRANANCLVCLPQPNLEAIRLFLQCALNNLNKP